MKKLLLLAGILVVASSVFGAATTEVSGDVDIYAQVVNNLSFIKGDPLNFGVVARGSTNSVVAGNGVGSFTIEGAQGVPVMISMSADGNTYKTVVEASSIEAKISLGGEDTAAANQYMNPTVKIRKSGETETLNSSVPLDGWVGPKDRDTYSKAEFEVFGTLPVKDTQDYGNYSGKLYVKAKYEDFPKAN